MKAALAESTALSQKSEREYITLRDSIKGLVESWKTDADRLREEMRKREDKVRAEAEMVGKKYRVLLEQVRDAEGQRNEVERIKTEDRKGATELEQAWQDEIRRLRSQVEKSVGDSAAANATAE